MGHVTGWIAVSGPSSALSGVAQAFPKTPKRPHVDVIERAFQPLFHEPITVSHIAHKQRAGGPSLVAYGIRSTCKIHDTKLTDVLNVFLDHGFTIAGRFTNHKRGTETAIESSVNKHGRMRARYRNLPPALLAGNTSQRVQNMVAAITTRSMNPDMVAQRVRAVQTAAIGDPDFATFDARVRALLAVTR